MAKRKPVGVSLRNALQELVEETGDVNISKRWSPRKQAFIDVFDGDIDVVDNRFLIALEIAGYKTTAFRGVIPQIQGCPGIRRALQIKKTLIFEKEEENKKVATNEERRAFWTQIMNNNTLKPIDRLRASELLAKAEGDFKETIEIDQHLKITQSLFDPEERKKLLVQIATTGAITPSPVEMVESAPCEFVPAEEADDAKDELESEEKWESPQGYEPKPRKEAIGDEDKPDSDEDNPIEPEINQETEEKPKKKIGRPKGSKNKPKKISRRPRSMKRN